MKDSNEELDPEIAELLGIEAGGEEGLLVEQAPSLGKSIPKIESRPLNLKKVIDDRNLYTKLIGEGGENGKRLHDFLSKFLQAIEKDEKSMYREKIVPAYWNMLTDLIDNLFIDFTDEKQALYRYGLLSTTFIDEQHKDILLGMNQKNKTALESYYVDEWLLMVGNGKIKPSSVDETLKTKEKSTSAVRSKLERKMGAREAEFANLKQKIEQHLMVEKGLQSSISIILNHEKLPEFENNIAPYSNEQKKAISQIQDILKNLLKSDREIEITYNNIRSLDQEIKSLDEKGGELPEEIDSKTVKEEFFSTRQMAKMTCGRQGNHFPFLIKSYMPKFEKDICTKLRLEEVIKEIEKIDPGVFIRSYKQEEHRIVPFFIIVPTYGDFGVCWEPFERSNKATSKGRIAFPMFPRNLKIAICSALGDLRWQLAKEKAQHHWMEEGITGQYYDYTQENKLKGDLKEFFIQDYILWIQFESQGIQKLHRDVRAIFWRNIPFPQELKDDLKNRGFYYAELYKKDQTRALSRGY